MITPHKLLRTKGFSSIAALYKISLVTRLLQATYSGVIDSETKHSMTQIEQFKQPSKVELLQEVNDYVAYIRNSLAEVNTKVRFLPLTR